MKRIKSIMRCIASVTQGFVFGEKSNEASQAFELWSGTVPEDITVHHENIGVPRHLLWNIVPALWEQVRSLLHIIT
jgi:hypothetical protein